MIRRSSIINENIMDLEYICLGVVFIMILSVGWIWLDYFLFNEYDSAVV